MSDTCGYTFMHRDGIEHPCGKPVTGHRWYQHVSHEDMLGPACERHRNVGGDRLHAAEADNARLRAGIGHARWAAEVNESNDTRTLHALLDDLADLLNPPTEGTDHE